jgi:hypothetical protein
MLRKFQIITPTTSIAVRFCATKPLQEDQQQQSSKTKKEPYSSSSTTKPERPEWFHSYTAVENWDVLRNKLVDKMSDIQREEHIRRESLKLNPGQSMADPIWTKENFGESYKKTKGEMDQYMNADTAEKWMRVVDAAKILGIAKEQVAGITQKTVEEKFTVAYQKAQHQTEKDYVILAAEVLLEYIKTPFAADITRARKLQALNQMREELERENREWHNKLFERLIYGMSGYVTSAITMIGIAVLGFYFYNSAGHLFAQENNLTVENIGRFMRKSMSYDPNMEATPDYTNRYRDTPTSYDMMQREGHVEIGDPNVRRAMIDRDKENTKELTMLAMMLRDKDDIEKKAKDVAERNEARRSEEPVGPKLLKEMMESRIDAEWWSKAKQLQAIYQSGNFVSKW